MYTAEETFEVSSSFMYEVYFASIVQTV